MEKINHGFSHNGAHTIDGLQLMARIILKRLRRLFHLVTQIFCRMIMPRQNPRCGFTDMADAKGKNKTIECNLAPRFNGCKEIGDRTFTPALTLCQLF